jgi:renalase
MSPKILVVGCGITGAAINRYITSMFPTLNPSYTFWEKSSALGGRMITNFKGIQNKDGYVPHANMGAQYLTRSTDDSENLIYSLLHDSKVITVLNDNNLIDGMRPEHLVKTHYIAPNGLSSVIDYLSKNDDHKFHYDTTLESINTKYSSDKKKKYFVASGKNKEENVEEMFDTIILTVPTPQLLELKGEIIDIFGSTFKEQLQAVQYSSRYAVALYYPFLSWSALASIKWAGKYVFDSEIIRYISIENSVHKPVVTSTIYTDGGLEVEYSSESYDDKSGPSILIHTSVPFGIQHKDTDEDVVFSMVLSNLNKILPGLGTPSSHHIVNWKESQINKGLKLAGFKGDIAEFNMPEKDLDRY